MISNKMSDTSVTTQYQNVEKICIILRPYLILMYDITKFLQAAFKESQQMDAQTDSKVLPLGQIHVETGMRMYYMY